MYKSEENKDRVIPPMNENQGATSNMESIRLTSIVPIPEEKIVGKIECTSENEEFTSLPTYLKLGLESISGIDISDTRVYYNSKKPALLKAYAYAQGSNIYIGPGQEKHLAHEAWHVIQQKQGRVEPTMFFDGKIPINDDESLEKEAEVLGKLVSWIGQEMEKENLYYENFCSMNSTNPNT
ncbi:MAG: DUF4157 domain-containing protein [Flavobacteriaceae bacterium]|nr:DUF4157 domain-containing protein [Flavobacteriaceae bacterium]